MRITPLTHEEATGDAAKALASPVGHLTIFRVLAHSPTTVINMMRLGGGILGKPQALDARTREMLVLLALAIAGGRYEWPQHVDIGLAVGMTAEEVAAIEKQDISASCFNERDQAVLAFGREVIVNVQVPQAVFDRAKAHLSEQAMVDAIVDIGFYMTLARVTEAFDIDADPPQGRDIIKSLER